MNKQSISKGNKKKLKGLDKYVIFCIVVTILYTIAEFVSTFFYDVSHETLTTAFYTMYGGETFLCALIKMLKLRGENNGY